MWCKKFNKNTQNAGVVLLWVVWNKILYFREKWYIIVKNREKGYRYWGKKTGGNIDFKKDVMKMVLRNIMLRPDEVKGFVAAASKCDFEIDIFYNRYVVDAKSILGVYGLDLTRALTVRYDGYNADFENFLTHLSVAC